jgi:hypothetical protein
MSRKPPKMPGQGGSYVRDDKGALSQKEATEPATPIQKSPASAKPATGKKEA